MYLGKEMNATRDVYDARSGVFVRARASGRRRRTTHAGRVVFCDYRIVYGSVDGYKNVFTRARLIYTREKKQKKYGIEDDLDVRETLKYMYTR